MTTRLFVIALAFFCLPLFAQDKSPSQRALDAAVLSSIERGDLGHARALAVTAEHWQWIRDANAKTKWPRSRAEVREGMANSQACSEAQRGYSLEAGAYKKNWAAIESKRQAARAACGSHRF